MGDGVTWVPGVHRGGDRRERIVLRDRIELGSLENLGYMRYLDERKWT